MLEINYFCQNSHEVQFTQLRLVIKHRRKTSLKSDDERCKRPLKEEFVKSYKANQLSFYVNKFSNQLFKSLCGTPITKFGSPIKGPMKIALINIKV